MILLPFAEPTSIEKLERAKAQNPANADDIEKKLRIIRAGARAEKDAAYHIDFRLKDSKNYAVLHGLRIECNGRVCQIDHLIIDRFLTFYLLETKSFHAGFKVTDEGEFLRWNNFQKRYEKMASPFLQSQRHQIVLKDVLEKNGLLPKRLGLQMKPRFDALLVIDPTVRVMRPDQKVFDTSKIVSYDAFFDALITEEGLLGSIGQLARTVNSETLMDIASKLAALHTPFHSEATIPETSENAELPSESEPTQVSAGTSVDTLDERPGHICKHCSSAKLEMTHGRFGYYFKCGDCGGNTNPKLPSRGKLRKEGLRFFFQPDDGQEETLFHTNAS